RRHRRRIHVRRAAARRPHHFSGRRAPRGLPPRRGVVRLLHRRALRRRAGRGRRVRGHHPRVLAGRALEGKMKFDGVIFDLDGVLCRTDELHLAAWRALASRLGIKLPPDAAERTRGVGRMESLDIVLGERSRGFSPAQKRALAEEKNALYRRYLQRLTPADAEPGARETLSELRRRGLKL